MQEQRQGRQEVNREQKRKQAKQVRSMLRQDARAKEAKIKALMRRATEQGMAPQTVMEAVQKAI